MHRIVIIQKENDGYTLHLPGEGRVEIPGSYLSEEFALEIFARRFGLEDPQLLSAEEVPGSFLLEGISIISVKRESGIESVPIRELFAGAITVMVRAANEQQLVSGYFPILSPVGCGFRSHFEDFFLSALKHTVQRPVKYLFPEFSTWNTLTVSSASIGSTFERAWGMIRDEKNLSAICCSIRQAVADRIGDLPLVVSADNYYIKGLICS